MTGLELERIQHGVADVEFKVSRTERQFLSSWEKALLLAALALATYQIHTHWRLSWVALVRTQSVVLSIAALLVLIARKLLQVRSESLLVLRGVGVQLCTTYYSGLSSFTFLDIERVRALVINEAIGAVTCHFYMAIIVEGSDSMTLVFPKLLPRIAILRKVYQEAHPAMFPQEWRACVQWVNEHMQ
eukprot:jgi/Chlat1/1088/Chrsp110S01545